MKNISRISAGSIIFKIAGNIFRIYAVEAWVTRQPGNRCFNKDIESHSNAELKTLAGTEADRIANAERQVNISPTQHLTEPSYHVIFNDDPSAGSYSLTNNVLFYTVPPTFTTTFLESNV